MGILLGIYIGIGIIVAIISFGAFLLAGGSGNGPKTLIGCLCLAIILGAIWPVGIFILSKL